MAEIGTREERQAKRERLLGQLIQRALHEEGTLLRSPKCSSGIDERGPIHANVDGGCANDGSTCLCECHDPKDERLGGDSA